tara:strand:- start:2071 stop:3303 length:1233 start_codon:yes stop_codon:yes gene_type:complete
MIDKKIQSVKQRYGIIGNSELLNHAIEVAIQVAPTDMSVLISGESGSGKESFSKIIHSLSKRKHGQFIAINCGAIPEGTIDSELFGHEKGSFTGANESRKGYFEVTDGGTIFLDEISEMPLSTQARLLRVLENGEFIKVGSSKTQKTNVRIIAASNLDLKKCIHEKKFREDLYYRLNTVPISVPPLRDRDDDITLLFRKFASDFSDHHKINPIRLDSESSEIIKNYRFPGNIRELKNLVEQISILELNRNIGSQTLLKYLPNQENTLPALSNFENSKKDYNERDILYKVLFDVKNDVNELKKLINEILGDNKFEIDVTEEQKKLLENNIFEKKDKGIKIESKKEVKKNEKFEEVTEVYNSDSLSLEKNEINFIIRALKKNNNKRKYAAKDLGISERTLYRKIKQYNLENF